MSAADQLLSSSLSATSSRNYGDLLFLEGQLTAQKREAARRRELERRAAKEAAENTFRPSLRRPASAGSNVQTRAKELIVEQKQRMEKLAASVRQEEARDLTFKPRITAAKTRVMTKGYSGFLNEMRVRGEKREGKLQQLRATREEVTQGICPFMPAVNTSRPASARAPQVHQRLYAQSRRPVPAPAVAAAAADASAPAEARSPSKVAEPRSTPVSEALYRDAQNRRVRRQMLQEHDAAGIHEVSAGTKVSARTKGLALQRLLREIENESDRLEATERGLTYEELAAIMVHLGVIQVSLDSAFSEESSEQERKEVLLLQRLWNDLSATSGEALPSEEGATPPATKVVPIDGLLNFVTRSLLPDGLELAEPLPDANYDSQLLLDFSSMHRNSVAHRSTGRVRAMTEELRAEEAEACTFEPSINARSRALGSKARPAQVPHHEHLHSDAVAKRAQLARERARAQEEELRDCSFKPTINGDKKGAARHSASNDRFKQLHAQHEARRAALLSSTEMEVAQECTFKPRINRKYKPSEPKVYPTAFDAAVKRLQAPAEERARKVAEEAAEAARRATATEKARPPKLSTEGRAARKAPLLYMDVNLGRGKKGRIALYQGDDAESVAANFAMTYQLDETMRGRLQALVERYLVEVVPSLSAAPQDAEAEEPSMAAESAGAADQGETGSTPQ